ncbi:MAG TPA: hypothetical protein PK156_02545 [Polyangium sp.]|nr:hypothetical protein [Polyangium sp.]
MCRPILLLTMLMILGGCHQVEQAPPPRLAHGHAPDSDSKPVDVAVHDEHEHAEHAHAHDRATPAGALVPRASVETVEPGQEALAAAILSASKSSLVECRGNSGGGTLRVKIVSTTSAEKITIDSDSKIDDKVRHCVLEALSTLDVPDTLSNSSPSSRPSQGFTSIIAINW